MSRRMRSAQMNERLLVPGASVQRSRSTVLSRLAVSLTTDVGGCDVLAMLSDHLTNAAGMSE